MKSTILHISDLCDLDIGPGHTIYYCVSLIDLYTKFHSNWKPFVDRRRYGQIALLGGLGGVDSE